jgi:RNA polymerase sigma factor (sigma-70 family)
LVSIDSFQAANPHFDPEDPRHGPEETLMDGELSEPVRQALDSLSPEERRLVFKSVFHEAPYRQWAAEEGCKHATLKTRVHRAARSLRRHLLAIDGSYATRVPRPAS